MRPQLSVRPATGVVITAGVVAIDQASKLLAAHGQSASVWPARNPDYAFGIIGGTAPFLVIGAVVVLGVFLVVADVLVSRLEISAWLPAVVAGGTIGNTLDRIRFGAARDFLVTPWAIINLADVAVAAGIIGLAFALVSRLSQMRLRASGRAADCVT